MFYVCVICMVSDKGDPLMELTGELRYLWERLIIPFIRITKLVYHPLLVCFECKQLLDSILKFRRTINIGAQNLISLYKALEDQNQPKQVVSHPLPLLINIQPDLMLPVASEEVVRSTESWDDTQPAKPVATNTNFTKVPRIIFRRPAAEKNSRSNQHVPESNISNQHVPESNVSNQHVPESNGDYAVLIPNGGLRGWKPVQAPEASLLLGLRATARNDATTQARAALLQGPRATARNDATTQARAALLLGPRATARNDSTTQARAALLQGPRATARNNATTQARASHLQRPRATARNVASNQVQASINLQRSDAPGLPEDAQCIRPPLIIPVNEKTNVVCKDVVANNSQFSKTTKIEVSMAMPKDATNVSELNEDKIKLNRQLFDAIKASLQSSLTEEFDIKYEPEREPGCEREPDFGHDSDSTLSCQSDYDDPEHYPNIIFARAFDGVAAKDPRTLGKGLEREGKADDVQIHSHIVTNPPSEWPCTRERCQLQDLDDEHEDGDEDAGDDIESPADRPRNEQVTRSKTKDYIRRFKCKLCGKGFTRRSTLWQHYEREHVEPPLKCNMCRKEFGDETELKFHKIKHQIKITADFEEYRPHVCVECGTRCGSSHLMRRHLLTRKHAAVALWRFQCDTCKRKFPDKKRIAGHIQREHLAKEAAKCPMCTATFKSARSLRRHATVHILAQAQESMHTNTQAIGQARQRRRTTHTNAEDMHRNILTNNEELTNGRRKKPLRTTHTKAKTYNNTKIQEKAHIDIKVQVNKHTETQTNRQRNTTDKNSRINEYSNRQDNTHTYTYINEQESMRKQTHLNGQTQNTQTTHTNTQTSGKVNTASHKITRNANGRVRKRRKKCPYTKRKRACTRAPKAQEPAVAKTSLFDMLSSFIL